MQTTDYVELATYRRDGSIRDFFKVSVEDAEWVMENRWHMSPLGYIRRCAWVPDADGIKRSRTLLLPRVVLGLEIGDDLTADHINRDPLDNRRCNLRAIPLASQAENRKTVVAGSPRGVREVRPGEWSVRVQVRGKRYYLGVFSDPDTAGDVAREFRLAHMQYAVD